MCPADAPPKSPIDYGRLTRRQAERAAGVSRATLARYVADGKLSANKDGQGHNTYDAAELARVFPDSFALKRLEIPSSRDQVSLDETEAETPAERVETVLLSVENRYLTEERDRLREEAERLRRELAEERAQRQAERTDYLKLIQQSYETVKLLTDQSKAPPAPPRQRGFLGRLLHRKPAQMGS